MKRMNSVKAFIASAALIVSSAAVQATDIAPDALAKTTTNEVLEIIKRDQSIQVGNQKKVLELVEAKVLPHFDFMHMTKLAVGKNWARATPAQQQVLVKEFKTLLVRTYSSALSSYKNQTIDFKPLKMAPTDTDVTVKTEVKQPGGKPIPIDYSMEKQSDGWKVYDVAVDGVSLVTNYRGSFNTEIRKSGIDGLIKTLSNKNQNSGGGSDPKPVENKPMEKNDRSGK